MYKKFKDEKINPNIWSNFDQYNLSYPEIYKMDIMTCNLKGENLFDAIITDPPYGFRASAR